MQTKTCSRCKTEKETSSFGKHSRAKDGLNCWCKSCKKLADLDYYKANREKLNEQSRENYKANKEQRSKRAKEYRELNADKIKSYAKEWRKSSDYMKLYREANKQSIAEYNKQWSQTNMDSILARNAIRKSKKLQAIPSWFESDLVNEAYEKARSLTASGIRTHVDHIVPLQSKFVCGLHCFNNLQLLDASANTSKGNRWWPDMW